MVDEEKVYMYGDDDKINLGITEYVKQSISIRENMSEELTRETVIHELCHCFMFSHGFCNGIYDEEQICTFFGTYADQILDIADKFMKERGEKDAFRSRNSSIHSGRQDFNKEKTCNGRSEVL